MTDRHEIACVIVEWIYGNQNRVCIQAVANTATDRLAL